MSEVLKEEEVKSNLVTASEDLQQLARDLGYNETEAIKLKIKKLDLFKTEVDYTYYLSVMDNIKIARMIPINIFGSLSDFRALTSEERDKRLWNLGIDTDHVYGVDVGCMTLYETRVCDYIITGQERTDKEWVTYLVNDRNVASWEAQMAYKNDPSLRQELAKLQRGS